MDDSRPATPTRPIGSLRRRLGLGFLVAAIVGAAGLAWIPAPYVLEMPGPVYDTLSSVEDTEGNEIPLISIEDAPTYPTGGTLKLLTVYVAGSPGDNPSWLDVIGAWFRPDYAVLPMDLIYPPGSTHDGEVEAAALQMANSQQEAIAAALTSLDIEFESSIVVEGAMSGYPADGLVEPKDVIESANGIPVANVSDLRAIIKAEGVGGEVVLGIRRGASTLDVAVDIVASENDGTTPVVGVYTTGSYVFPFDVSIELSDVGGSSAGMMFALGIIDELTPGQLNGGEDVAGTGEITALGDVGVIGGIVQKAYAARDSGARWLLVPEGNCADLYGHVPDGIREIPVTTLDEALSALSVIAQGTDTDRLPRCTAP